jgi:hypothetical protein
MIRENALQPGQPGQQGCYEDHILILPIGSSQSQKPFLCISPQARMLMYGGGKVKANSGPLLIINQR